MGLIVLLSLIAVSTAMISEQYPILDAADKDIPEYVQHYYPAVGMVIRQNTPKRSVGYYFAKKGFYSDTIIGDLCNSNLASTPAYWGAGSGAIIGPNTFLTAYHVPEFLIEADPVNNIELVKQHITLVFNFKQTSSGTVAKVQYTYSIKSIEDYSKKQDWIILRTTKGFTHNSGTRYTLASKVYTQQEVYTLGYPLGQPLQFSEGIVVEVDPEANSGLAIYGSGFSGSSGSPIVRRSDGEIVGVFANYNDDDLKNDFVKEEGQTCYKTPVLSEENYVQIRGPLSSEIRAFALSSNENQNDLLKEEEY